MKTDDEMRARIRQRREAAGLSQTALGIRVGASQQTIDRIERGTVKFSRVVPKILETLGMQPPLELPDLTKSKSPVGLLNMGGRVLSKAEAEALGVIDIRHTTVPVYSTSLADGGFTRDKIVEYVQRPDALATVHDGYGVFIADESMAPVFRLGDIALVHPHKPPQKGSDVLLYQYLDGSYARSHVCTLSYLPDYDADYWKTIQWRQESPDEPRSFHEALLSRRIWTTCHVIVARLVGR